MACCVVFEFVDEAGIGVLSFLVDFVLEVDYGLDWGVELLLHVVIYFVEFI